MLSLEAIKRGTDVTSGTELLTWGLSCHHSLRSHREQPAVFPFPRRPCSLALSGDCPLEGTANSSQRSPALPRDPALFS